MCIIATSLSAVRSISILAFCYIGHICLDFRGRNGERERERGSVMGENHASGASRTPPAGHRAHNLPRLTGNRTATSRFIGPRMLKPLSHTGWAGPGSFQPDAILGGRPPEVEGFPLSSAHRVLSPPFSSHPPRLPDAMEGDPLGPLGQPCAQPSATHQPQRSSARAPVRTHRGPGLRGGGGGVRLDVGLAGCPRGATR